MITKVTIEGFKSFGSPGSHIELGRLNFIVGANASGKTNFVSALKFLRLSLLHGLDYTVNNEFGGCRETRNRLLRERGEQKPCCLGIQLAKLALKFSTAEDRIYTLESASYAIMVDLRSDDSNPVVVAENFEAKISDAAGNQLVYKLDRDSEQVVVADPTHPLTPTRTEPVQPEERAKFSVASGYFGRPAILFRELVVGWSFFNISSQSAREPAREIPGIELGGHGENLAAVLHEIEKQNGHGVLKQILDSLRGAVPQVQQIKPLRSDLEGKWSFQIIEERIRGGLNPSSISDGTIRLLTLLVAAQWAARNSSLLVIEEPENNLHPHLNEQLVATFRAISEDRQIIVTTHNPGFLDYLEPDELLLCERDRDTTFTRMTLARNRENVDLFRDKYRLGDLWVQGMLGGMPE